MIPCLQRRDFDPHHPERMDDPHADPAELAADLAHLRTINRWFGGHTAARFALRRYRRAHPTPPASILDVCCGSGDLTSFQSALAGHPPTTGLDLHPITLAQAAHLHRNSPIRWRRADATALPFPDQSFDLVTCHLALHHFSDHNAVCVLREIRRVARRAAIVTDLIRSTTAYVSVWLLVHLWMKAPMTRHDALLSVRRAFNAREFRALAHQAGWTGTSHHRLPWHRQGLVWINAPSAASTETK